MPGTNVGSAVPQIFYDIIARVIPGFAFLCGVCAIFPAKSVLLFKGLNASTLLLLFFAFYLTGFLLDIISNKIFSNYPSARSFKDFINDLNEYPPDVRKKIRKFISVRHGNVDPKNEDKQHLTIKFLLLDWIRKNFRSEGLRLQKLRAEARMFKSLMLVFIVLFVISLYSLNIKTNLLQGLITIGMLIAFYVSIVGYKSQYEALNYSIVNFIFSITVDHPQKEMKHRKDKTTEK